MPTPQRRPRLRRHLGAVLIALGALSIGTWAVSNGANASGLDGRVTICRATGHDDHPYERAEVSVRSLVGDNVGPGNLQGGPIWYAGAGTLGVNWGDIVPPVADVYPNGVNWSEGSRVWGDDCRSGVPPTSAVPSTTGCTTTTTTVPVTTAPPTTSPSSSVSPPTLPTTTTVPATTTTVPATTVPASTAPTTTVPASTTTPTIVPATTTPSPGTTTPSPGTTTPSPGTTAPGSSVLPPTVPSTSSTIAPASSVSPPGPLPTSGSDSLGLLLVGVLLVLLGLVLALTSAHA